MSVYNANDPLVTIDLLTDSQSGAFDFLIYLNNPWGITQLQFYCNDQLVVTIPFNWDTSVVGSTTISVCPITGVPFAYYTWNGGERSLGAWKKCYWWGTDSNGYVLAKSNTVLLQTALNVRNLLQDSINPLKLSAPRPFYGKNKFYDIYIEELFDWYLAEIKSIYQGSPGFKPDTKKLFTTNSPSINNANFVFSVYKFCQPDSATHYDIVDPATLRGFDAVNEAYLTGSTLLPMPRTIYRVYYDKANDQTRIKHSHPMFLPLYIKQLRDTFLISLFGGISTQAAVLTQFNKLQGTQQLNPTGTATSAVNVQDTSLVVKSSLKRIQANLGNISTSDDVFPQTEKQMYTAIKTNKDNGVSDYALNLVRPSYPCAVKSKDNNLLFIDALRAKADGGVTDQSLLGKFSVLRKDGTVFQFTDVNFLPAQLGSILPGDRFVFWNNGTGEIIITDRYLRFQAKDTGKSINEIQAVDAYNEKISFASAAYRSLRFGATAPRQGQIFGNNVNVDVTGKVSPPIATLARPAGVNWDSYDPSQGYFYSDWLYIKFNNTFKKIAFQYGSSLTTNTSQIDWSSGPDGIVVYPNYNLAGNFYSPPLGGFYRDIFSAKIKDYYLTWGGGGGGIFGNNGVLGAFILDTNGNLWQHSVFNSQVTYFSADTTDVYKQGLDFSDVSTPNFNGFYNQYLGKAHQALGWNTIALPAGFTTFPPRRTYDGQGVNATSLFFFIGYNYKKLFNFSHSEIDSSTSFSLCFTQEPNVFIEPSYDNKFVFKRYYSRAPLIGKSKRYMNLIKKSPTTKNPFYQDPNYQYVMDTDVGNAEVIIIGKPYLSQTDYANYVPGTPKLDTKGNLVVPSDFITQKFYSHGIAPITWKLINAPAGAFLQGDTVDKTNIAPTTVTTTKNMVTVYVPNIHGPFYLNATDSWQTFCCIGDKFKTNRTQTIRVNVWPGTLPIIKDVSFKTQVSSKENLANFGLTLPRGKTINYADALVGNFGPKAFLANNYMFAMPFNTSEYIVYGDESNVANISQRIAISLQILGGYYFEGLQIGKTSFNCLSTDGSSSVVGKFNVYVWDVTINGVSAHVALTDNTDPTKNYVASLATTKPIQLQIIGNSSYPHTWKSSNTSVATIVTNPQDSRQATLTLVGKGTARFYCQDSGEVIFVSPDFTVQ